MKNKMFYYFLLFTTFSIILLSNCKKKEDASNTIPVLTTTAISAITTNSSTGGGNISSDGNETVTSRGVCWSTSQSPTISNNKTSDGSGTGTFTSSISGLTANTTYYVRAYATNSVGTAYGDQISFTTLPSGSITIPVLTTTAISGIAPNSAHGGGNISSDGNSTVTLRGVCWSTSQSPTISDNKTSDGSGTGTFTSLITGLTESTTYYVRAYATNSIGTGYGNQVSFTTITSAPGTVIDIDGNVYNTITIGTQVWTKENLKVLHYRNGDPITNVTDNTSWSTLSTEAYCWYNDSIANGQVYGALYNWYAIHDARKICPVGWHVPSAAEWNILEKYLDPSVDTTASVSVGTDIGSKLKEAGTTHWTTPNASATNASGFTGLPGGYRYSSGTFGTIHDRGLWWTATQVNIYNASIRYLGFDFTTIVVSNSGNLKAGYSLRLIKD